MSFEIQGPGRVVALTEIGANQDSFFTSRSVEQRYGPRLTGFPPHGRNQALRQAVVSEDAESSTGSFYYFGIERCELRCRPDEPPLMTHPPHDIPIFHD